ncbi:MAG: metal ABC transporter substrate-binding protein [Dehalococcoidia bacterium]
MRVTLLALVPLALLFAACDGEESNDGRLRVLATTSVIAEFAEAIAGEDAVVVTLVPAGVDLHAYEAPVRAARDIARAGVVLVNGCNLEQNLLDAILLNRSDGTVLAAVSATADELERYTVEGFARARCDPHRWLDVARAMQYADAIGGALAAADPAHGDGYARRTRTLVDELAALDAEVRRTLDVVLAERRRIVVFHDAFAHFAASYGFELSASVLPSGSGQDPAAGAVAGVIKLVRESGVRAVFHEPQFPSRVFELVAEETGARILALYSIPIPGEVESYAEMMRANARALADGLAE